ncbi:MAG: PqqD family protein [Deltaproteobacteria bacterium]|nr:PqqD family protein [Deltaproteobacteria bacterium]
MVSLNQCPQKTDDVVSRKIEDQFILIPIRSNVADLDSIYTLNETGARIYELIDGQKTLGQIKAALVQEYDVEETILEKDLLEIANLLKSIGGIQWKN